VVRYLARHGESRVAKAAIISGATADGEDAEQSRWTAKDVFDGLQAQFAANRSPF
jgi:non-heme chloroperoxidase